MPRIKAKYLKQSSEPIVIPCQETPAYPNVHQAARHFGFKNAQAFRRWAQSIGAHVVKSGRGYTYNLKELESLWDKQAVAA
jgi:hypothetical protein